MSYPLAAQKIKYSTILIGILLFAFFMRLPSLFIPHTENDEVIYKTLTNKVMKNPLDYSLQGTYTLTKLPPEVYDYPIFRHPPLFVAVLASFFVLFGKYMAVFVPALFGVFTIAVVYLIAKRLFSKDHGLVAALILACCPLWLFLSMRIWIETMVTFLTALSFYFVMIACDKKQSRWFIYSGLIFGLALLTKQVAILILPALFYYAGRQDIPFLSRTYFLFIFISVAVLVNVPWLVYYYKMMGTLSYGNQYHHTDEMLKMFPIIEVTVNRPWYYYFTALPSIYPMYLLSFIGLYLAIKRKEDLSLVIWSATVFLVYTLLGGNLLHVKLSYTMRFISLALPALAIMASYVCCDILSQPRFINLKCIILMAFLFYGTGLGILNYLDSGTMDTVAPSDVLRFLNLGGHSG